MSTITADDYTRPILPPTAVPCPHWCSREAGHGWEGSDPDGWETRGHSVMFGNHVDIDAQAVWRGAREQLSPPTIGLYDLDGETLDADGARALAADLLAAADRLEEITR